MPVSQLIETPRESRLLRETDEVFIKKLKAKMVLDPSNPYGSFVQGCLFCKF